jgi:carbon storage regulator CsrA
MLVLTRKDGEAIRVIAPDGALIEVKVIDYPSPKQVRVGVKAPEDYKIHRANRAGMLELK